MGSQTSASDTESRPWLWPIAVAVLALAAHGASLGCGWIWDDDSYITANRVVQSPDGWLTLWDPGATPQYYPFVFLGFWIQHAIFGLEPFTYHLINVLMHAANAALLLVVLERASVPRAFWIAALFAVHPMGVESVAWVTERKNVQSMLFALASVLAFMRVLSAGEGGRFAPWIASFLLFIAALLSKTTAIFVPPCLVLLMLWQHRSIERWIVGALTPFFIAGLVLGLFTAYMEKTHVGASGDAFVLGALERVQLAGRTAAFYLATYAIPTEQIFIYPRFQLDAKSAIGWIPALLWLAAFGFAIRLWRRTRAPLLVLLWIGAGLFPALGFFNVWPFVYSFVADHFAYAAMPAFGVVIVSTLVSLGERIPRAARFGPLVGVVAIVTCIALSIRATPKYESEEILWRTTLAQNPSAWIASNNIASILLPRAGMLAQQGRGAEAAAIAREALGFAQLAGAVKPDEFSNAVNRSEAHRLLGELDEALREIDLAMELEPWISDVRWVRARVLESLGRRDEAREEFREAARLATKVHEEVAARRELLRIAAAIRDVEDALAQCARLIALNPDDADMRANRGSLLVAAGRLEEARGVLREVTNLPMERFSRESVWVASTVGYLRLAIEAPLSPDEAAAAKTVSARLMAVGRGDPLARYLSLALALALGDESVRPRIVQIADEARAAGATQFADEITGFLARRGRSGAESR